MERTVQGRGGERFHDMDLARAIILLSGVFFHAAFIYSVREPDWYVTSAYESPVFDALIAVFRTFRMEALFIVSGFFSALLVSRSGSRGFARNRFVRMGVPLVVCGTTLNSAMFLLSDASQRSSMDWWDFFAGGHWQAHLWNVGNLLAYEAVVFAVLFAVPVLHAWLASSRLVPWLAVAAYPAIGVFAYRAWEAAPTVPALHAFVHPQQLAMYAGAYLFGYALHRNAALRENLLVPWRAGAAAVALLLVSRWIDIQGHLSGRGSILRALDGLQHLSLALLLFALVKRFQTDNIWVKRIAIASYTIYIVHMPLQIALFRLVDPLLPNVLGYLLIATASLGLSWWFHVRVVERWDWAGFLINGKVYHPGNRSF